MTLFNCAAAGLCEVSTLFLNILLLSKSKTATGAWLTNTFPKLLMLNGMMLWHKIRKVR